MFVFFEGLDKTGKTSLMECINKKTKFEFILRDRGPAGYLAYDEIYDRATIGRSLEYYKDLDYIKNNLEDIRIIYCVTDWRIVKQRLKEHEESCDYDYTAAQEIYARWIDKYNCNTNELLIMDTTEISLEDATDKILKWLNSD